MTAHCAGERPSPSAAVEPNRGGAAASPAPESPPHPLSGEESLAGVVVDESGKPLAGVTVSARLSCIDPNHAAPISDFDGEEPTWSSETDNDGHFLLAEFPHDDFELSTSGTARGTRGYAHVATGRTDVRIIVTSTGVLRGTAVDESRHILDGVRVDDLEERVVAGRFEFPLPTFPVEIWSPGRASFVFDPRTLVTDPLGNVDVGRVVLGPGRPVRGMVLDAETGRPVEGAMIQLPVAVLRNTRPRRSWCGTCARGDLVREVSPPMSDADEAFELTGLEPGEYSLDVRLPQSRESELGDFNTLLPRRVRVKSGAPTVLELRPRAGGTLLHVTLASRQPSWFLLLVRGTPAVPSSLSELQELTDFALEPAPSRDGRRVSFSAVHAGVWTVIATKASRHGVAVACARVDIGTDREQSIIFTPESSTFLPTGTSQPQ